MDHTDTHHDHADAPTTNLRPMGNAFALAAGIAFILSAILVFTGNKEFAQSYLYAYIVGFTAVIGCLGLTLLHHCVRGTWGLSCLRIFEAGSSPTTLGVFAIMFLPIAYAVEQGMLFTAWTHPEEPFTGFKGAYLTPNMFLLRAAIMFLIWIGISAKLRASSIRQDSNHSLAEQQGRTDFASPMLVIYMLSATLMATDWVMSLDPHWFSAIYGVLFAMSAALSALSFATIIILSNRHKKPYVEIVTPALTKDLGNLLFMFTMLWGYMSMSQWIIMWCGNLPEFIHYYTERNGLDGHGPMAWVGGISIIVGFFVCWGSLLFPRVKREPKMLLNVAWLIFIVRIFDLFYHVMGFMKPGTVPTWTDAVALVATLGMFVGMVGLQSEKASLYPEHDQRLKEAALNHHG